MRRSNYHALHVLKTARPKLRKAIISNINRDLVHSISECTFNVLNGNIRLRDSIKCKLKKHKSNLRSLADNRLPLTAKKRIIVQRYRFLLPLLTAVLPTLASQLFRFSAPHMTLRKMFLVPAEHSSRSPAPTTEPQPAMMGATLPALPSPQQSKKTRPGINTKRTAKER
jgi:hypothetical protein